MNISSTTRPSQIVSAPKASEAPQEQAEDPISEQDKAYNDYLDLRQQSEKFETVRMVASSAVGIAAGAYLGSLVSGAGGIGGHLAGAVIGGLSGVTTGALVGSGLAEMNDAGSGALAYLGMGVVGGGVVGLAAGAFLGGDVSTTVGAIAGGVGGLSVGYMGGQMIEDSIDKGNRKKAGLDW